MQNNSSVSERSDRTNDEGGLLNQKFEEKKKKSTRKTQDIPDKYPVLTVTKAKSQNYFK